MRQLIGIVLLSIAMACAARPAQPLSYPLFAIPESDSSTDVQTSALVLIPLSTQVEAFTKSAALLSSLCEWIRRTPDVRRRYASVWLAFNSVQDPISSAALSMQQFSDLANPGQRDGILHPSRLLRSWLNRAQKTARDDYRGLAKDAVTKSFQLSNRRVEAYACFGDTAASTNETSVLAIEHTRIEPYGPGIAYFMVTPKGGKHGYLILKGDSFEKDVARVAALTLPASEEDVIRASISLDIPPEGRCSGDAALPCAYVAFRTKVSAALSASTFASTQEVEVRGWRVEDESGARGTAIVTPTTRSQEQAVLTFTRPGTFRVVAAFATRTEPALWLERSVRIAVRVPSLILFNDPPSPSDPYDLGIDPLHRSALRVSCRTLCQPLSRENVRSVLEEEAKGVVRSRDVERILTETAKAFGGFDLGSWKSFEPVWRGASDAALGYQQIADLVGRISAAERGAWCVAVSDSIASSLLKSGVRAPGGLVTSWQEQCRTYASQIKPDIRPLKEMTPGARHLSGDRLLSDNESDLAQHAAIGAEVVVVHGAITDAENTVPFILDLSTQVLEEFRFALGGQFLIENVEGFDGKSYRNQVESPIGEMSWRLSFFIYDDLRPSTRTLGDVQQTVLDLKVGLAPWCLATEWAPRLLHRVCHRLGLKLLLGTQFERSSIDRNDGRRLSRGASAGIGAGTTIAVPLGFDHINITGGGAFMFYTRGWNISATIGIAVTFGLTM